jgi:orotidine-5'-phosphate decarboxylase
MPVEIPLAAKGPLLPDLREPRPVESLSFIEKSEARERAVGSKLCIGLDPDINSIPESFKKEVAVSMHGTPEYKLASELYASGNEAEAFKIMAARTVGEFAKRIVDFTHDLVAYYKPNIAFYARYGEWGVKAYKDLNRHIEEVDPSIVKIFDGKRGDIGATNEGYADELRDIKSDAITVNPYFGIEGKGALGPLLDVEGKGIIILCRTSNPEAKDMQDVIVKDEDLGEVPYWMRVAKLAERARQKNPNVAIVMGATNKQQLREVGKIFKGKKLVPGLGKQGGKLEDLIGVEGVIPNNASGIIHKSKGDDWAEAARAEATVWRDGLRAVDKLRERPDIESIVAGMTSNQIKFAKMALTEKVEGKLVRRYGEAEDFTYEEESGDLINMLTIATDSEHEFVGAANLADKQNPNIPLLPDFINLRGASEEAYELMAQLIKDRIVDKNGNLLYDFDYITGIPNTGPKIGKALAKLLNKPYYELLDKAGKGSERKFVLRELAEGEGPKEGEKGIRIDDLITQKQTKDDADAVMSGKYTIVHDEVVVDREEGGLEEMLVEKRGIGAGITRTQMYAIAYMEGVIDEAIYDRMITRIENGKHKRKDDRMLNDFLGRKSSDFYK